MSKGIETRAVFLVVAVIAGLVFLFIIFKFLPSVIQAILINIGWIKLSNVESAALCSYYRCAEGCMSMKVQEITWTEGDKSVSCNDFCHVPNDAYEQACTCTSGRGRESALDRCSGNCENVGTICSSDANCTAKAIFPLKVCDPKYPVNVTLSKEPSISQDHIGDAATCIVTSDSYIPLSLPGWIFAWDDKFVYIDKSLLKNVETGDCIISHGGGQMKIVNAIKSANIKTPFYIYTYQGGCPAPGWCIGLNNLITEFSEIHP